MAFDVAKAVANRLVLIRGPEEALRIERLRLIVQAALEGGDEADASVFTADSRPLYEWTDEASTIPFLAARRVVVVRNLRRNTEALQEANLEDTVRRLSNLPASGLLILVLDEERGKEDVPAARSDSQDEGAPTSGKRKKVATWDEVVGRAGGYPVDCTSGPAVVLEKLREFAAGAGKQLSAPAARKLAQMSDNNLGVATSELEKLISFVGATREIRESDVDRAVEDTRDYSIWALVDAVLLGRPGAALRELDTLTRRIDKVDEETLRRVFPMLARQLRLAWQARACLDEKIAVDVARERMPRLMLDAQALDKLSEMARTKAVTQARRLDLSTLTRCFEVLALADGATKGFEGASTPNEVLEHTVLELARICARDPA